MKNKFLLIIFAFLLLGSSIYAGPEKYGKNFSSRSVLADTSGTDSVSVVIGSGAGQHEDILGETFVFLQDSSSDWYSIYNGFIGLTFAEDSGMVYQSRYVDQQFTIDGEIYVIQPMGSPDFIEDVRVAWGMMEIANVGAASGDTLGPAVVNITQKSYIRNQSGDKFFVLEYWIANTDTNFALTDGKMMFFCDVDVGNSIYDNLTATDSTRNMIYQYSVGDDYCGFARLFSQDELSYGNFNGWYFAGTDVLVDSIANYPDYNIGRETSPGDHSVYLVADVGDFPPDTEKRIVFAFALGRNLTNLQFNIDAAANMYASVSVGGSQQPDAYDLITVYPNPFNSTANISLYSGKSGFGSIVVYDPLGRQV